MIRKSELVIHPVRMRILSVLASRPMTTKQLAAALPDVPPATLYRQVKRLLDGTAIEVVERRTINGIVESTYATVAGAARFDRAEFAGIPGEDHIASSASSWGFKWGTRGATSAGRTTTPPARG